MKTTRYHKSKTAGVVCITTNSPDTARNMIRYTDRKDPHGYTRRKTQEEAEKDPTP